MPETFKIIITGQVQGVGFRPLVYGLSKKHQLNGDVSNNELGVIIHLNASESDTQSFLKELLQNPPVSSIITSHLLELVETRSFENFSIIQSEKVQQINLPLTPDFAVCDDCKSEILDSQNRRYHYPFTTCVNCGPRYSITTKFSFEREHTSMSNFKMCKNCQTEYENPENRRFHSQTNSCQECGISLELVDRSGNSIICDEGSILKKVSHFLSEGHIIAIKNTNGYLLCCDASNSEAITRLRKNKNRPTKPFALLYPDLEMIRSDFKISDEEQKALTSSVAPIVILPFKDSIKQLKTDLIAPNLNHLGVMLPSSAILHLLMTIHKKPVIATSGNLHGSSIISKNKKAKKELKSVADYFLHHNLDVQFPQDDSVMKFSYENQIILRRSRGLAPNYIDYKSQTSERILAMGAHLKSTFAFIPNRQLYVSQYFGNLDSYDVFSRYKHTTDSYFELFKSQPNVILVDKHPQYQSTIFGNELASKLNIKCIKIQHHKAHFASVLGEHELFDSNEKILGVVWDGTGFGDDGMIWGGEFFTYANHQMSRLTNFQTFDWIAADKMSEEPRLSLLSLISEADRETIKSKFIESEWKVYMKLLQNNTLKTSSVGRLFDAMSSLLGLIDKTSFEGEAAMLLEKCAQDYEKQDYVDFLKDEIYDEIPSKSIIKKAIQLLKNGHSKEAVAASFIFTLAKIIIKVAKVNDFKIIACSGGVFQNITLLNHLQSLTENSKMKLKINRKLSSNDENISFGQIMYYLEIENKI